MTNRSKDEKQGPARRAAETTLDFAIGGTALAAKKAAETLDRAAGKASERGEKALESGREALRETVDDARSRAADAVGATRESLESPDHRPYEERTRDELYQLAAEREIPGRSRMLKVELIEALRESA